MCLNFEGELTQKCDKENREWRSRQIKSIYRLHLDLVVKKLYYINCLNAWATSFATFRNQILCCGTVFLDKNDEMKNSSSRKTCFLFRANWTCLSRAGRESYPPASPPLGYASVNMVSIISGDL